MADDLRAALVEAKLAGTKAEDGAHAYLFRSNEAAAVVALDELARWLFGQANSVMGYALASLPVDSREREDELYTAKRLRDFAGHIRSLTQTSVRRDHRQGRDAPGDQLLAGNRIDAGSGVRPSAGAGGGRGSNRGA